MTMLSIIYTSYPNPPHGALRDQLKGYRLTQNIESDQENFN